MDLRTFYSRATLGDSLHSKIKQIRSEFFTRHPDSVFLTGKQFSLDSKDGMIRLIKNYKNLANYLKGSRDTEVIQNMHLVSDVGSLFLHFNAFLSTIQMLGTNEQVKYWENLSHSQQVLGAYAQTEMGHGSDVQGLMCTAEYDPSTQQFTLNNVEPKSGKYWPGVLGINCTHCVLQAQTYIKGQHIGVQTFVVPIRDKSNSMKQYPGVDAGDIGPKLAFKYVDNGYLYLRDYKIPREYMLMRYCQVEKDGEFKIAGKKAIKLGYGSMLNLRVILVSSFCYGALVSTSLAYHNRESSRVYCENTYKINERQIGIRDIYFKEDFARHTAYLLSSQKLKEIYSKYKADIIKDDPNILSTLAEIHILSAGFKACSSWAQIQTVRQNTIYNDPIGHLNWSTQQDRLGQAIPAATYEGDNHVLLQQTGKYLLKFMMTLKKSINKKSTDPIPIKAQQMFNGQLKFLFDLAQNYKPVDVLHNMSLNNYSSVQKALEMTVFLYIQDVAQSIYKDISSGEKTMNQVFNEQQQDKIVNFSKFFIHVMNIRLSKEYLEQNKFEEKTKQTLELLLHVYLLSMVELYKQLMFTYQLCNASKLSNLHIIRNELYSKISDKFLINSFDNPIKESFTSKTFDEFQNESALIHSSLKESFENLSKAQQIQHPRL